MKAPIRDLLEAARNVVGYRECKEPKPCDCSVCDLERAVAAVDYMDGKPIVVKLGTHSLESFFTCTPVFIKGSVIKIRREGGRYFKVTVDEVCHGFIKASYV